MILPKQLMDLLSPKHHENFDEEKKQYEVNSKILINENSGIDIGNAIVQVIAQSKYEPYNFYKFLEDISFYLDKTIEFIEHLWKINKSFIIDYCSGILRQLRFSDNYEKIYWEYVQKLQAEDTIEARNCILHVYNSFNIHNIINKLENKNILKNKDVKLITSVFYDSIEQKLL